MENRGCVSTGEIIGAVHRLQPFARRWARNRDDADDLIQSTAERALRTTHQFRPGTNATAWVRAIMYHLAVDMSRRHGRERALHAAYGCEALTHQPPVDDPLPVATAWSGRPTMKDVRRAVPRLREPLRRTFVLWAIERRSYREISGLLGIPISTVATRLLRARRDLRRIIAADQRTAAAVDARPDDDLARAA